MIERAKELLEKHGALSVPLLMRHLKCTQKKATDIMAVVCVKKAADYTLALDDFIKTYWM